jgi:hypothetical protein
MVDAPLMFVSKAADGWVMLSSGLFTIATYKTQFKNPVGKFVIAILAGAQTNAHREEREFEVSHASV